MGSFAEQDKAFILNTGAKIPAIGLGTWQSAPGQVAQSVRHAISVGYRHIDAAYFYGNEGEVGAALRDVLGRGEVRREDLFITTKLWCTYHGRVEQNLDLSFDSLGLDYVDLYLMHWLIAMNPNGDHETHPRRLDGSRDLDLGRSHVDTYRDMEKLLATGKARAIGVANYSVDYLRDLLAHVSVVPAVNQVDSHPQLPQAELLDFCRAHGIHNTAYSPLGSTGGPLLSVPAVQTIAAAKQVSPGNILLSYHVARGCSVLAKSVTPSRIQENRRIVNLNEADMEELNKICQDATKRYLCPDFGHMFGWSECQ